jgi:hypothetical protein
MQIVRRATESDDGLDVARALALDALRLGRVLRDRSRWPASWSEPGFGAEVERLRRQMARITTREGLTAAYAQAVFQPADAGSFPAQESPIRVAYALRWLELFDGATGPSWPSLVS